MEKSGKIEIPTEQNAVAEDIAYVAKRLHDELMKQFNDKKYVQQIVIASMPAICESIARPMYITNVPLGDELIAMHTEDGQDFIRRV